MTETSRAEPPAQEPARAACNSCQHEAPRSEMIRELKFNWTPTGNVVCRDAEACFGRWVIL